MSRQQLWSWLRSANSSSTDNAPASQPLLVLQVKEAALTGESEDVLKTTQPVAEDAGLG